MALWFFAYASGMSAGVWSAFTYQWPVLAASQLAASLAARQLPPQWQFRAAAFAAAVGACFCLGAVPPLAEPALQVFSAVPVEPPHLLAWRACSVALVHGAVFGALAVTRSPLRPRQAFLLSATVCGLLAAIQPLGTLWLVPVLHPAQHIAAGVAAAAAAAAELRRATQKQA
ncbi:unnamed protein product [Pedinophyceae sp. YPF-701]|nr:unnamed protein product [Pedinophyceae sp. YPF-701]